MNGRADRWINAGAFLCLVLGIALSHVVEPGVEVEHVTLASGTPALRFVPAAPGRHPIALLAHGVTASKETLFRLGEALAVAGFESFAVDQPGHGASPYAVTGRNMAHALENDARAVGGVDVFLGHSMGSYVGAGAVRNGGLNPKLFIAVGALPRYGPEGPPLLLLAGLWEEAISPARLREATDARLLLFPLCDHAFEPYDPPLVRAAVEAACVAVGKTPPAQLTRWIWRLAGLVIGMAGTLVLLLRLPALPTRWAWVRGPMVAVIFILAMALTCNSWFGMAPHLRRFPAQLILIAMAWLTIWLASKLRIPRWSFAAFATAAAIACAFRGMYFLALIAGIGALVLFVGRGIGWIATRNGSLRNGDLATAIFVGYAFGQLLPTLF